MPAFQREVTRCSRTRLSAHWFCVPSVSLRLSAPQEPDPPPPLFRSIEIAYSSSLRLPRAASAVRACSTSPDTASEAAARPSKDSSAPWPFCSGCRSPVCASADSDELTQASRTFPIASVSQPECLHALVPAFHGPHRPPQYFCSCRVPWPDRTIPECAAPS